MNHTDYNALLGATWKKFYSVRDELTQCVTSLKSSVNEDKYCKAFNKVVKLCLEKDVDPLDYVEKIFDILIKQHKYILPCDIAKRGLVDRYIEIYGDPQEINSPVERWNNEVKLMIDLSLKLIPAFAQCEDEILMDPARPFEPWFRVFYANGMQDLLIKRWGSFAWEQLVSDDALMEFCVTRFKEVVEQLKVLNQ